MVRPVAVAAVVLTCLSCGGSPTKPNEVILPSFTALKVSLPPSAADPGSANQGRLAQPGATIQLTASAIMSDGSARTVTTEAAWQSSNDTVTTVSSGAVTAVALGWSEVSAAYQGQRASVPVIVGNCAYSLKETGHEFAGDGGDHGVPVQTSTRDCRWDATVPAGTDWVSFPGGPRGSGTSELAYRVARNPTRTARDASIRIADQNFAVHQAGSSCTYRLGATSANAGSAAATGLTVSVTATPAECSWQATSNDPSWLTITQGSSGTGNGTVTYSVAANTASTSRTGTLTIAGQTFTVTQNPKDIACSFSLGSTAQTVGPDRGQGSVTVTASPSSCGWTATSNAPWITVTSGATGTGTSTVGFAYGSNPNTPNSDAEQRTGTLTIAGQTVTVTQQGRTCPFVVTPTGYGDLLLRLQQDYTVAVTAPAACEWTATSPVSWVTVKAPASGHGTGSATVIFGINANEGSERYATVSVAGQGAQIRQAGMYAWCHGMAFFSPTSISAGAAGGTLTVPLTGGPCYYGPTVADVSWITIVGGSEALAPGPIVISVAPNRGPERVGYVTASEVRGSLTVTQAAGSEPLMVFSAIPRTYRPWFALEDIEQPGMAGAAVLRFDVREGIRASASASDCGADARQRQ